MQIPSPRERLDNARTRLDSQLLRLPPAATNYAADQVHRLADEITQLQIWLTGDTA